MSIISVPSRETDIRTLLHGVLNLRLSDNKHVILTVHEFFIKITLFCTVLLKAFFLFSLLLCMFSLCVSACLSVSL